MLANLSNNTINKVNKIESSQDGFSSSNIVFIDPRVDNFNSLLSGLKTNVEAVILDSNKDGIEQITEFLKGRTGTIDSVQILSHGSAGNLQLGSTQLNSETLETYQESLKSWFSSASGKTPDLLLYGCDVASGEVGESFIQNLSQITGADVAASVDLTGNATKGGNWILEKATGAIEAGQAFTRKVRDAYQDILAVFTVTNTNDAGAGSLREAITLANSTTGADTINFNIAPGGPQTIRVGSTTGKPLPYIRDTVTINGETQPGFTDTNTPIIVLDGTAVGGASSKLDGLRFVRAGGGPATVYNPGFSIAGFGPGADEYYFSGDASNSVVQGLVISNFSGSGIKLGNADVYTVGALVTNNITVQRNYIGTDITGTVAKPTSTWGDPNDTHALHVYGSTNSQLRNNLVSGNYTSTIVVRGTSSGTIIDGNKVGTDVTGRVSLGNQRWAVYVISGAGHVVTNNLVSTNGQQNEGDGEPAFDIRVGAVVSGNKIGTDITGTYSLQNRGSAFNYSGPSPGSVTGNTIQGPRGFPAASAAAMNAANTITTFPIAVTPTLAAGSPLLSAIPQNSTSNNGTLVKDIVGSSIGNYAPIPTPGIAITARDNTYGTWEYSTDNGANWADINLAFFSSAGYNVWGVAGFPGPTNNPPVSPDVTPALLLAADDKNRVRFIPNASYQGTTNGVTYRAWNQRFGANGQVVNISGFKRAAGSMTVINNNMSANSNTAQIQVLPNNIAPTLVPTQVTTSSSFVTGVNSPAGVLISDVLLTSVTDPDAGSQQGVAITDLNTTNGTWQYSINGQHWIPIAGVSDSASLLLDNRSKLRFIPNTGYIGAPGTVTLRAWDQTNGTNGSQIDTTVNGGFSSISSDFVILGNSAPVLTPALVPATTPQTLTTTGVLVSDFAAGAITDIDIADLKGIAITNAPNIDGNWEYSLNGGASWISMGAVSPTNALLLDINNKVRFVPIDNNSYVKNISFRAWDQTGGSPGNTANVSTNGGFTSFSNQLATAGISITGNTAPVLTPALVPATTPQTLTTTGVLVSDFAAGAITDIDIADLKGIAITNAPNIDGNWEYSLNGGASWISMGAVSPTNALLLDINNKVRFVPIDNNSYVKNISFRAWDQTGGSPGSFVDASIIGGFSPFSTQSATPAISIPPGSAISVPVGSGTSNLSPELLSLLRNPPAAETPPAIVVGTFPISEQPNGNAAGGNSDCPCEQVIAQQQPNLVSDKIWGTNEADFLVTTEVANTVYGLQGSDTIVGTIGSENLFGGAGNDQIRGAKGRDFIRGGSEDDVLYGGRGRDVIKGGRGNDLIFGGRGADFLAGGTGEDTIYGGRGNDFISGGKGNDRLFGGLGDDTICGCEGDDFLRGGRGNDVLYGGAGNDTLVGGLGDDTLTGGAGSDRFRLVANHGTDTITDFAAGVDFLELARGLQLSDLQIVQGIGGVVIGLQPGSLFASDKPLAVLVGVNAATLTPNSFLTV